MTITIDAMHMERASFDALFARCHIEPGSSVILGHNHC
ncbi:elongation factor tu [Pantoea sp. Acro-835]|uniref:Elongation factor tu n=1 Tax=Candidatus Pantoea multigeneris TaxID=2608357 RepID=A0ABX0RKL2_9GAMM|nr:elongation factor tu [Pantoea multigeneris]